MNFAFNRFSSCLILALRRAHFKVHPMCDVSSPISIHSKIVRLNESFGDLPLMTYDILDNGELIFEPRCNEPFPNISFYGMEHMQTSFLENEDTISCFNIRSCGIEGMHIYLLAMLSKGNYFRISGEKKADVDRCDLLKASRAYHRVIELTATDAAWSLLSATEGTEPSLRILAPMEKSLFFDYCAAMSFCGLAMIAVRKDDPRLAVGHSMCAMEVSRNALAMVHAVRLAALAKGMRSVVVLLAQHVFIPRVPTHNVWREWSLFDYDERMQMVAALAS